MMTVHTKHNMKNSIFLVKLEGGGEVVFDVVAFVVDIFVVLFSPNSKQELS